jgi:hypothetical protein
VRRLGWVGFDACVSAHMLRLIGELRAEWQMLDSRFEALNGEFVETARQNETICPLKSILSLAC